MKVHILQRRVFAALTIPVVIFLGGCNGDTNPCETPKTSEKYTLGDDAKALVHHYNDASRIIFKTPAGVEIAFEVVVNDTLGSYQYTAPCEADTSEYQAVEGTSQAIEVALSNGVEFTEPIYVNLYEIPTPVDVRESLVVSLGKVFSNTFGNGDELFYYIIDENNTHLNFYDSLSIAGKTFYSVFEMKTAGIPPKLDIKYTAERGIIYIKNLATGKTYVYERKE